MRIHALIVALLFAACPNTPFVGRVRPSDPAPGKVAVVALASPVYPQMARVANIWGDVNVTVKLRPNGTVEAVAATTGHPVLAQAALESARQTQFECRGCSTETESYQMLYTFRMVEGADCCHAMGLPPTIEQLTRSASSGEPWETHVIVSVEHSCLCDPVMTITRRKARSVKCLYLWRCSTH
jgi:TonB family protein